MNTTYLKRKTIETKDRGVVEFYENTRVWWKYVIWFFIGFCFGLFIPEIFMPDWVNIP